MIQQLFDDIKTPNFGFSKGLAKVVSGKARELGAKEREKALARAVHAIKLTYVHLVPGGNPLTAGNSFNVLRE